MNFLKWLLLPFSFIYGLVIFIRNLFYDLRLLKPVEFDIPVISVGNLSVGGTGKTPHVQHLIQLLKEYFKVAVVSRGYKRKTRGYILAKSDTSVEDIGDEPYLIKQTYPSIPVSVCENRVFAIPNLLSDIPETEIILLDDAFQHRAVTPGFSVLLTGYDDIFTRDFLLPVGRLREWRSAYKRADIIVVTKCPENLTDTVKNEIIKEISPVNKQQVCFSYLKYGNAYYLLDREKCVDLDTKSSVLLFCGIDNPGPLVSYLKKQVGSVQIIKYPNHYYYRKYDLEDIKREYEKMQNSPKIILTTEKDAVRLSKYATWVKDSGLPVYCVPVRVAMDEDETQKFNKTIFDFIRKRIDKET